MMRTPCSLLLALVTTGLMAQAPTHFARRGAKDGDLAGTSVVALSDVDGDGVQDLLVAEPGWDGPSLQDNGRVLCISGRDQDPIWIAEGAVSHEWLGLYMVVVGDLNQDGIDEWASSDPNSDLLGNPRHGRVVIHDGATGAFLREHLGGPDQDGDGYGDGLGYSVGVGGDVDGDGVPDYILGAISDYFGASNCFGTNDPSYFEVRSGATGNLIHPRFAGAPNCMHAGHSSAILGDLDGDGRDDFVLGFPEGSQTSGRSEVRDGATGALIATRPGLQPGDFHGMRVARAGDLDLDGIPDYAAAAPNTFAPGGAAGPGYVHVYSGQTHQLIRRFDGYQTGDFFGLTGLGLAGDVNGDGVPDYFASAAWYSGAFPQQGRVVLIDGANGNTLRQVDGESPFVRLGRSGCVGVIQDLDGDTRPELLAGSYASATVPGSIDRGLAAVFGSRPRLHWIDSSLLQVTTDLEVRLEVRGAPGEIYLVLGSLSGAALAGSPAGGFLFPLVIDPWFLTTLLGPSPIQSNAGVLDADGRATATLPLPAGGGFPAGITASHWSAVLLFDTSTNTLRITRPSKAVLF